MHSLELLVIKCTLITQRQFQKIYCYTRFKIEKMKNVKYFNVTLLFAVFRVIWFKFVPMIIFLFDWVCFDL